jgi:beta-lactamase regulating signal transducer with metallopeptidase domain
MNSFAQVLLWCPVQITVLALAALAIGTIAGRRRPAAGALVAAAALLAVVGLTATALSPWPTWAVSWDRLPWTHATAASELKTAGPAPRAAINLSTPELDNKKVYERPMGGQSTSDQARAESFSDRTWAAVLGNWVTLVAVLYLVGVGLMALRIALGLVAVRGYRRNSHPITDRNLSELADVVCAQLGCTAGIELRESTRLATPATIGWLRPMLLLPANWRSWTDDERHAVLAHEIEHVRRNDFASWMAAQLGIALHFYHPLVHWLANRLRLQQELAADAAAARLVGGQRKYVTTLAALALRQADSPVAWPARAFLPNSKTFVRRIEMLHRSKSLRGDVPRSVLLLSVAAIVLVAACAAGIRGSAAGDDRAAGGDAAPLVVAFDQAEPPAKSPLEEQRQTAQDLNRLIEQRRQMTQDMNNLKQLGLAMHNYGSLHKNSFPPAVLMGPDGKTPHSWRVELLPFLDELALYKQYRMNEPWDSENNKKVLERMPDPLRSPFDDPKSTNSGYYVLVGPGTMFEGKDGIKIRDITDGTSNTLMVVEAKRNIPWTKPEDIAFDPDKPLPELGGFVKGEFAAALGDGSARRYYVDRTKDQLKWLIQRNDGHKIDVDKLGNPRLSSSTGSSSSSSGTSSSSSSGTSTSSGSSSSSSSSSSGPEDILASPEAASENKNNLKQLALAMHNYHDVNHHFPPAVVIGPDGKTPHSWRVELLQSLGPDGVHWQRNVALYKRYRMNEPWDSENNKQVLEHMPGVFRSPYGNPNSTSAGYFALAGPGTVFEGPEGVKIQDITDGTSNTLMIVEAKRNIPWTKPEDIPFDPEKPLPELGGFIPGKFTAALADGSVHTIDKERVKENLKWLIMRNDGHPIDWR